MICSPGRGSTGPCPSPRAEQPVGLLACGVRKQAEPKGQGTAGGPNYRRRAGASSVSRSKPVRDRAAREHSPKRGGSEQADSDAGLTITAQKPGPRAPHGVKCKSLKTAAGAIPASRPLRSVIVVTTARTGSLTGDYRDAVARGHDSLMVRIQPASSCQWRCR